MKKELIYLIEYSVKNPHQEDVALYIFLVQTLASMELYTPTKYTQEQIIALMKHAHMMPPTSLEEALKRVDSALEAMLPKALSEGKKRLFHTLIASNFPKKKGFLEHSYALFESQLEPVEKSIYHALLAYIAGLNRGLGLFYCVGQTSEPETFVVFGKALHVKLLELIFNEEEKALLSKGLSDLMGVYVGLYGNYLYTKSSF